MSEVTNIKQSLQYCQNKLDLAMECFNDLVKNAIREDKDEEKMELLTFIQNSTKRFEKFTEMLFEEPKVKNLKKEPPETSEQVADKKLKLSPSPLMDLPNEIWMKILSYLPTHDILKNFNLTCKQFHSLAINPSAIKSLQLKLKNIREKTQYQNIVKVLNHSKSLNEFIIEGSGLINHFIAHALKSKLLKTLDVSSRETTLSKKNLEHMKNSNIEVLKLNNIILDKDAMHQIGALMKLKSIRISNFMSAGPMNISELIKNFLDAKVDLKELEIVTNHSAIEIDASTLGNFLKERGETLKKFKVRCFVRDDSKSDMKWNATSNLEELYFDDFRSRDATHRIEFGPDFPKLTKLAIRNINQDMLNMLGIQNFPVLERLYLDEEYYDNSKLSQQTIFNILANCPKLKSVRLVHFDLYDNHTIDEWCALLCEKYQTFSVYFDILDCRYLGIWKESPAEAFEKYLKKNDLATFYKYTKLKANYLDWKKGLGQNDDDLL